MSELHQKAEEFVLCALADDTCGGGAQSNEVGLFLLQLILGHKKGQLIAAPEDELSAKTKQVVVSSGRACQEIKP
ncbi:MULTISPECIES: hypothetical protein [Vibrionaceae]|uniref:hypothetical protein n=1 Tax=Vibrionaceae TaxID=641 RepID=UPI001121A960|nr:MULTISPECIES: hypothetical protein [Vibrionaceae]QSV13259.1 hypothetical protein FH974_10955 [Photobacterium ganghwense]